MDRYLLKNIIIIILVLVNGFLLGSLVMRQTSEDQSRRQREEQLVALFAADEINLDADAISDRKPSAALSFTRNMEREQDAAAFFLGADISPEDQGGGITTYTSSLGTATFRSNGSFDIRGTLSAEDARTRCEKFCRTFSYNEPAFTDNGNGSVQGKATYLHDKLPVFNCSVSFTLENGVLTSVVGTLLPEDGTLAASSEEPLSASAALLAFQQMRRESSMVVSAVTETYLCYELQNTTTASLSLVPAWCIVTDTSNYYVNCISGVVTSG